MYSEHMSHRNSRNVHINEFLRLSFHAFVYRLLLFKFIQYYKISFKRNMPLFKPFYYFLLPI